MDVITEIKTNMSSFHHLLDGLVNTNVGNTTENVVKFVNKFKMINKESILQYHNFILDRYVNPNSLSLIYKVNKWNQNYLYPELLYLNDKNELIISQIMS